MSARVMVSIRVAVPPERAFDVFTDQIGQWWQPSDLFRFTPRCHGRLAFEGQGDGRLVEHLPGGRVFEVGRVTAWDRGALLAFTWRQATFREGQLTHVTVRFEPVGQETRVTVDHAGWETVPQDHVARHTMPDRTFMDRHARFWQAQLASLRILAA